MINLEKFDKLIEMLRSCVEFYNYSYVSNNKVTMYLANGDKINIRYPKNGIAHLLGVNIDYLRLTNKFKSDMNSYECLLYFLEESYSFRKLLQNGMIHLEEMFSCNIDEKLACFRENMRTSTENVMSIVKYDSEKTYQVEPFSDISNYYIVRHKNGSYYVLGLVKDSEKEHLLLPVTSRKYDDYFEFDKFMRRICCKQELTYPNKLIVDNVMNDYYNEYYVSFENKIKMIEMLLNQATRYDATPSVGNELLYMMRKLQIERQMGSIQSNILNLLIDSVRGGNVFSLQDNCDLESDKVSGEVNELIGVCNDLICSNHPNESAVGSYSKLEEDYVSLKEQYIL